jgi:hypothetical protein
MKPTFIIIAGENTYEGQAPPYSENGQYEASHMAG